MIDFAHQKKKQLPKTDNGPTKRLNALVMKIK